MSEFAERVEPRDDEAGESMDPQVERAVARIERRAEHIRDRELETALAKLEGLDDRERAVVERLATRLTERLLTAPKRSLARAAGRDDDETIAVARELFGE